MQLPTFFPKLSKEWWWGFVTLVIFAVITRFWALGAVPTGLAWDEAAIGYNGYAVITTRRDEWLTRLPISFRSFGDYKAPLAIYTTGVFVTLLGSATWVIRLPFALMGVAATLALVIWLYQLLEWLGFDKKWVDRLSLFGGWLMAISPWHLQYSRVAFESGFALSLWLCGAAAVMYGLKKWSASKNWPEWWTSAAILKGVLLWVAALYTYHSSRLVVPVLGILLGLFVIKQKWFWRWQVLLVSVGIVVIAAITLTPLYNDWRAGDSSERFKQASILTQVPPAQAATLTAQQWLLHLDPRFLVMGETPTTRHGLPGFGVLSPLEALLVVLGLLFVLANFRKSTYQPATRLHLIGSLIAGIGLLPAAIGVDVTHSNRALLALPGFTLMALAGTWFSVQWLATQNLNTRAEGSHGEKNMLTISLIGTLTLLTSMWWLQYWHTYLYKYPALSTSAFSEGYKQVFAYVVPIEKGLTSYPKPDQIVMSSAYGQPYIYALLAKRTNPIWYRGGSLNTYLFLDKIEVGDLDRPNTIVVASGQDNMPFEKADHVIRGSDGSVRFAVFLPKEWK